ncbi:carbon starvation protein A, partial [Arthrobacter deserti]|nr:carbon starvation protein A [Arthrobacter deserti]
ASILKIFSPDPKVGYWANNFAYRDALARGETSSGPSPDVASMEAGVRNTTVQGTLSIVFVVLTIIVIAMAILATVKSWRSGGGPSAELPAVVSRTYAPAGLVASQPEKELEARWNALPSEHRPFLHRSH